MKSFDPIVKCAVLLACVLPSSAAYALLPPPIVECCQRRDFTSRQCEGFKLDDAACVKVNADWVRTYNRWHALTNPKRVPTVEAWGIERVDARLYFHHSGTFSAPIQTQDRLLHAVSGDGAVRQPSNALRVDVVLKGEPDAKVEEATIHLEFVDSATNRMISAQSATIGAFSPAGEHHTLFVLQPVGCVPLKITARVTGAGAKADKAQKVIKLPFQCGN